MKKIIAQKIFLFLYIDDFGGKKNKNSKIVPGVISYKSHNVNLYCEFHENVPEPK